MEKIEKIIEEIDSLTVVELNDLVKAIEEKYGVSAVAAAAPAAGAAAGAAAAIGAEADTPNFSSRAFTSSDSSRTVIFSIASMICSLFMFHSSKIFFQFIKQILFVAEPHPTHKPSYGYFLAKH